MWKLIICGMISLGLAGCETALGPDQRLAPPARFAMAGVAPLPDPAPGKSCAVDDAQVRNIAGARGDQVVTLQRWVLRVIKGKPS
jgi:hypothetical protein